MGSSRASPDALAPLLAPLLAGLDTSAATAPLETLLTSPRFFGLATATPLQRAICRIVDGVPLGELAAHPHVVGAVGDVARLPRRAPRLLVLLSGIRGGKSLLAAAGAVRMAMRCDLSRLTAGEIPRVSIVSVKLDLADVVKQHLIGNLLSRPALTELLLEEPKSDSVLLRHPSGRPIEVKVVAGSRAGSSLVARWSAGVIFDEAPRMVGAAEGVVNLDDMRAAVAGRLLPGACRWEIGSPWAPFGPVFETTNAHQGKPSAEVVVVRAAAPWLNPVWWTPERVEELRTSDPTAFRTDVEAQFADPEEALVPLATIEASTRAELVEEPRAGHTYVAAIDPATRGNAWTLVVGTRRDGKRHIVKVRQWVGSPTKPLDPAEVLREVAIELRAYRLDSVETDQWSGDALAAVARQPGIGLSLVVWPATSTENTEMFLDLARRMAAGEVVLPPDAQLRADLQRIRRRVTSGGVAIVLPQTSDGRHCDYAPAVARVVRRFVDEPRAEENHAAREEKETLERVRARFSAAASGEPRWRRGYGR